MLGKHRRLSLYLNVHITLASLSSEVLGVMHLIHTE
uniref:Uncharacterized protein n=1 Tax=Rhizophora mucronata TaxID=61149 RepID=A0A2P2NQ85_RHIMU